MMKTRKLSHLCTITFALIILISTQTTADDKHEDASIQPNQQPRKIDKDTFLDVIAEPEIGTLVMFYAPWCGHCKRMVSTWSQLAHKHNPVGKFLIAKIDCADQTELCSDNDVLGYPTWVRYYYLFLTSKLITNLFVHFKISLL